MITSFQGKQVSDLLFDFLADIGDDLNTVGDRGFRPRLARSWEWARDSLSITFRLDPRARWHDGRPVTARDVRFTVALLQDTVVASQQASNLVDVDSVAVPDSLTAVFWFKRRSPEQFYSAVYNVPILPEHLLARENRAALAGSAFDRHPVGSGRFRFGRWDVGQLVELVADSANWRGRPRLDRVIWTISEDFTASAAKLFAGEADFVETMRPDALEQLKLQPQLRELPYAMLAEGFLRFNLLEPGSLSRPHALFAEPAMRRAITMAIDRARIGQSVLGPLYRPLYGPAVSGMAAADTTLPRIAYDSLGAARLLDSLDWRDANGDGLREKNGRPLRFGILAPSASTTRARYATLLQDAFRRMGAQVSVDQLEPNAFNARLDARRFDVALDAFNLEPTPSSVAQAWSGAVARSRGSANSSGYANPAFDAYADSARLAMDPTKARAYYRRAFEIINADAPAVWLYEVKNVAAIHRRIRTAHVRPDAWWAGLDEWWIPRAERLPRDGPPPSAATPPAKP